jgi:ribosomal protein S18 acetylase RimI-like enzyme
MPFILLKENAIIHDADETEIEIIFSDDIPTDLIDEFISLQDEAYNEITQDIFILKKGVLVNKPLLWDKTIRFCLVKLNDKLIAYGIGHKSYDFQNSYYVSVIFVDGNFRRRSFSKIILNKFVNHFISDKKLKMMHSVTQPDNQNAINLLNNFNFQFTN